MNDNNMHMGNMSNDAVVSQRLFLKAHFHTQANLTHCKHTVKGKIALHLWMQANVRESKLYDDYFYPDHLKVTILKILKYD